MLGVIIVSNIEIDFENERQNINILNLKMRGKLNVSRVWIY